MAVAVGNDDSIERKRFAFHFKILHTKRTNLWGYFLVSNFLHKMQQDHSLVANMHPNASILKSTNNVANDYVKNRVLF